MSQDYSRGVLRVAVAQICQSLGWTSIHAMPLELLTDVLERYLLQMGKVTHRYSEQFGRTTPRLEDLGLAFSHLGIRIPELEDYLTHIDPLPFAKEVVSYPIPCETDLKFPNPESKEVQQRKVFEFVPEHLPYMHPELNEDEDEDPLPPRSPERLQVEPQVAEMSPGQGEKRLLSSPGEAGGPFKRPRLTTSQPLPEEAFHSQHEMTSVVMTNSGILSPLREGKLPDTKPPPTGFKQIVIVKQKSSSSQPTPGVKLSTDTPIIKLDFSQESGTSKIVEVDKDGGSGLPKLDRNDPDFVPKKKKLKDIKKAKMLKEKIKKVSGKQKSPGRGSVVHNKGAAGISKILALSRKELSKRDGDSGLPDDSPMDLSNKPTPPMPGINVHVDESAKSKSEHTSQKIIEYRPKVTTISKQQEKDMEDTIASVIEKSSREVDIKMEETFREEKRKEEKRKEKEEKRREEKEKKKEAARRSVSPHEKPKPVKQEVVEAETDKDTWRVSHISETYSGDNDDSFDFHDDDDHDDDGGKDERHDKEPERSSSYHPPGTYIAPHLALLQASSSFSPSPPSKTRGRPRGSGSAGFGLGRSPRGGRKPGRPPLNKSPGRGVSVSRSPGRPPLNRSPGPGRPPLNRSPGRPPGSGRSPGRPKGSTNISPKPRGRPRGSKSPRSRMLSPRGGSPRAITHINFDEDTPGVNSRMLQDQGEESETKLFGYPSGSPSRDSLKDRSPTPTGSHKSDKRSPSPSPKFTPERRDMSPDVKLPLSLKREPTPDASNISKESSPTKRESSVESDFARQKERSYDFDDDDDRPPSRNDSWKEPTRIKQERSVSREKENRIFSRIKDQSSERETSREKDSPVFEDRESSERDFALLSRETEREKSKEREREREHKEHSRDREHHSKDRDKDKDRSKEHKKDKKKKKKKDKDKDRDRDKDRERKEKHKKEKEHREDSPSVQTVRKLTIKIGDRSSSSSGQFSISKPPKVSSPKPEPAPPPPERPEIPKLKFKVLPPKPDGDGDKSNPSTQSWKSVKTEYKSSPSPKPESYSSSKTLTSPKSSSEQEVDVESVRVKQESPDKKDTGGKEEEVTVSLAVVGGKIMGQKPVKRNKRKGSKGQRGKTKDKKSFIKKISAPDTNDEDTQPAMEEEQEKDDPLSPLYPNQNVPSPITIPALKAAPPPPSPPTNKKSPPKPRSLIKEPHPQSPLSKEVKSKPPSLQIPKAAKISKSPRRSSPRKSPKISPQSKKKSGPFSVPSPTKTTPPPSKSSSFSDSLPPKSPSPSQLSSPSFSPLASPMYSPASSPARDSPLHFMIPPTPAFPTRTNSPPVSTDDDEKEVTSPGDPPQMPPPLPPMPPSAQKKGARTVVAETVGSFVNECGEKIWICPACTMQDDGSPMIGCDKCDDWYHWPCVNIVEEPSEEESWYCPKCVRPNKSKSKRGRKKKKP